MTTPFSWENDPARRKHQLTVVPTEAMAEEMGLEVLEVQKVTDTPGMKALRIIKDVLVIVTCLVLLYVVIRGYFLLESIESAFNRWVDGFTSNSILGD